MCSKIRSNASQQRGSQTKTGLRRLKRSSWINSNTKRKATWGGSKDRYHVRNRDIVRAFRNQVKNAKVLIELNLARNVRGNKKGFCIYASNERRTRKNVGPFWKEMVDLTPWEN